MMNADSTIASSSRFRRGYAAPVAAAVAGVVAFTAGVGLLIHLPSVPYNVPQIFPAEHQILCIAIFAVLLLVMGFTPAAVASVLVRRPQYALWTPVATVVATLVAWALLRTSVTTERIHKILGYPVLHWGWDWELICRFLALYGGVMLLLILAAVIVVARRRAIGQSDEEIASGRAEGYAGRRAARRGRSAAGLTVGLILFCLPWLMLARLVVINWADTDNLTELIRSEPYPGDVFLALGVIMIGLNAAALARVMQRPSLGGAALAVAATVVLVGPGWGLLKIALVPALEKYDNGIIFSAIQFLLGANRADTLPEMNLFLRWSAVQIGAVLVLAYGGWTAMRVLGPRATETKKVVNGTSHDVGSVDPTYVPARPGAQGRGGEREVYRPAISDARWTEERQTFLGAPGRVYWIMSILYLAFVIYGSLVPLDFHPAPLASAWNTFKHAEYLNITAGGRADLVANLLLFIPLTFFFMGALTRENRRAGRWAIAVGLAALAAGLAVSIEFTQVFFPPRTVSLNDIQNESIGGGVGITVWMLWGGRISRWVRGMWGERIHHALAVKILITYTVVLCVYQWLPFDLTIRPAELWEKWKAGNKITVIPFTDKLGLDTYMVLIKFAIMIPVGLLMAHLVRPGRHAFLKAAGLGMLVAVGIEMGQLFVYSRYASITDILLGTLGVAVGVGLADRVGPLARRPLVRTAWWRRYGQAVLAAVALAAVAAYLCLKWRVHPEWPPFRFAWPAEGPLARLYGSMHVPLYYQYFNTEFSAAAQVLRDAAGPFFLAMLFMPLASRWGRWARPMAALAAATIGVAGEMARIFLPTFILDPVVTPWLAAVSAVAGALIYDRFVDLFIRTPPTEEEADAGLLST